MRSDWWKAAVLLFGVLMVVFRGVFFGGRVFYFADDFSLMVPGKIFLAQSLKSGAFPFWNPYVLSGTPFFADINQSVLYPSTLLFLVFPPNLAVNFTVLLHFFIGAMGVYVVARQIRQNIWLALTGATVWMLSAVVLKSGNNLAAVQSIAWIPWMVYMTLRVVADRTVRTKAGLIVVSVLALLGGHPQPVLYAFILSVLYVLWYPSFPFVEKIKQFWMIPVFVFGMLAVLLMPALELSNLSTRGRMTVSEILDGSMHPAHLIELVIPSFFSDPSQGVAWGPNWGKMKDSGGYVTVVGLAALAIFAFKKKKTYTEKFFLITGCVSLVFALGKYMPFVETLYTHLAILRLFRSPSVILVIWILYSSVIIGKALENLHTCARKRLPLYAVFVFCLAILLLSALLTQRFWFAETWQRFDTAFSHKLSQSAFHTQEKDRLITGLIFKNAGMAALLSALLLFLLSRKTLSYPLVWAVVALDLWIAFAPSILLATSSVYNANSLQAAYLRAHSSPQYRYLSVNGYLPWSGLPTYWENVMIRPPFADSRFTTKEAQDFAELKNRKANLVPNWGMVERLSTVNGYATFVLKDTADYWETTENGSSINDVDTAPLDDPRMNDQGVRYILLDKRIYPENYLTSVAPSLRVIENTKDFAILENPLAKPIVRPESGSGDLMVRDLTISPNRLRTTIEAKQPGKIVVMQTNYPGWSCHMGEKPCQTENIPGGMTIAVDSGEVALDMQFLPTHFRLWLSVSLVSLAVFLFWVRRQ